MKTFWWIMGGTASGKKTLAATILVNDDLRTKLGMSGEVSRGWIEDGPVSDPRLVAGDHILLRWQWGRERVLKDLAGERRTDEAHVVVLTYTDPRTQAAWAERRERHKAWDETALSVEAASVRDEVLRIVDEFGLRVVVIDTRTMTPKEVTRTKDVFPVFERAEVEICSRCDVNCPGCDRFMDVGHDEDMTVEQIERFVWESEEIPWRWERVHVLGGEPTLHPRFRDVVSALMRLRELNPLLLLRVITNGRGKFDDHAAWLRENGVEVSIVRKRKDIVPYYFDNMMLAPQDDPSWDRPLESACGIFGVRGCGIGVTRYGYFLCGAGASIARVTGIDVGVRSLREVTMEAMLAQAAALCRVCGHRFERTRLLTKTGPTVSAFWERAIADYRSNRPILKVFGGEGRSEDER